ncbi:hypothetical protein RCL_jg19226.t1 [Rhizophagus clarus]|uniref:Uncharacterized protein n=1 Tax=Rhizophagus clarus TaxID=94130 RepID=A0A8H3M1I1_9GLOM|nr:hypothetical protein RCL_jg19226.t1 [Rhizophagus clarus]
MHVPVSDYVLTLDEHGKKHKIKALVDTGCSKSTVGEDIVKKLKRKPKRKSKPSTVNTNGLINATHEIRMSTWFGESQSDREKIEYDVGKGKSILIGMDIIRRNNWNNDYKNGLIKTKHGIFEKFDKEFMKDYDKMLKKYLLNEKEEGDGLGNETGGV